MNSGLKHERYEKYIGRGEKQMKIVILVNDAHYLYNTRYELVERLIKDNYEVYIVCEDGLNRQAFEQLGAKIQLMNINRHSKNPFNDLKILKQYKKILREVRPDVVLTYNIKPNIYGGMLCRKNKINYITNITGLGTAVEYPGVTQKITVAMYRIAVKNAYCIFFQNKENKSFFDKHKITYKKSKLLPGSGVNLDKFELLEYPETDETNFMFIARILKEKGIDEYLEAAEAITAKYDNVKFHVIGQCDDERYIDILKEYDEKNIIKYHGVQKDIKEFQRYNSCTVLPSYYPEGMNNVLLESAASGRPIITTNRSGCGEVVDDGVNGFIVKQRDSKDLIRIIEKFMLLDTDRRAEMGVAGRRKVENEFDRNIVIEAYIEELNSLNEEN